MDALRVLTNSLWFKEDVMSAAEFWRGWDVLQGDNRFAMVSEPKTLEAAWRRITKPFPKGKTAETDAYFAAFASAAGFRLVTFDRGFSRFSNIDVEILA